MSNKNESMVVSAKIDEWRRRHLDYKYNWVYEDSKLDAYKRFIIEHIREAKIRNMEIKWFRSECKEIPNVDWKELCNNPPNKVEGKRE